MICAVQSGDRDESFYDHPEKFDIHRGHHMKDTLAFGYGVHRCQAEWLSRAELEIVFGRPTLLAPFILFLPQGTVIRMC